MIVSGFTQIKINLALSKALDLSTVSDTLSVDKKMTVSNSETAANEVDALFHDQRSLSSGVSEELDLTASLTDGFGDLFTVFNIKFLYIRNTSTENYLLIGGATSNAVPLFVASNNVLKLPPDSEIMLQYENVDGLVLGTNDKLKIAHNGDTGNSLNYDIVIGGLSTAPTPTPTPTATPTPTPTPTPT